MTVQQMVCPACGRMHGRDHAPGCPQIAGGRDGYHDGWNAAKESLLFPALEAANEARRHLVELAALAYVEGHTCKRPQFPCEVCDAVEYAERIQS